MNEHEQELRRLLDYLRNKVGTSAAKRSADAIEWALNQIELLRQRVEKLEELYSPTE